MTSIYIKSSKAIIKLISSKEAQKKIINDEFLTSYIPSVEIIDDCDNEDAIIIAVKTINNEIDINYPKVYYKYKSLNSKDIISLIEFIFERCRQEKGIICIHGSGAIVKNKLVACFGTTTGMGKTSLSLALSNNNLFYSDEKILIDLNNCTCVGRIKNQYISNNYWKIKYGNINYYEPHSLAKDIYYKVGLFVEPIICEQKKYVLEEWKESKFLWHLYEESSRKIRGTSRILFNNTYPVMSLDTESLSLKRLNLIKKFTKNVPAIYYKGPINKGIEIIEQKLE